ncbi:hypothetical protein BWQ96_09654 [Gracilariopsis chorda]|uniref:Uncharacterized protein n=1 Tax=Gracilariopsis chorda TaxID=448386 RepID=A0A2V3IEY6_9FLOR|nr:hypothetical protein BWQ96_09654 [Gracilariopsis chorda]|eukprot:PXF40623.1 hypothetical protein BWQ96_09654 [Gracilariopsis chorda]
MLIFSLKGAASFITRNRAEYEEMEGFYSDDSDNRVDNFGNVFVVNMEPEDRERTEESQEDEKNADIRQPLLPAVETASRNF